MKMNKKGQSVLDNFGSLAIGVGALCITLVVAFLIMAQAHTNMKSDGTGCAGVTGSYNWVANTTGVGCCNSSTTCAGANWTDYNSLAYNATGTLQTATAGIPGWVSIIIITAIGAALIGMVAMFKR